jgi:serine/threonine protein kinase
VVQMERLAARNWSSAGSVFPKSGEAPESSDTPPVADDLGQTTVTRVDPLPHELVAGLELRGELARGGLGVVYLAYHPYLRDFRALKRPLHQSALYRKSVLARFRREVEAIGALRHDHVIRAHDAGVDAEGPYLVMEFLDGKSLSKIMKRRRLSTGEACELIRQAALGLEAARQAGLVHRDIKPSNLILARANAGARVVVIDWGLVKRTGAAVPPEGDNETVAGTSLGTPDFMAPEQATDASTVDIRADVYSLGVTFYCLLAGRVPFHDREEQSKLQAQVNETFPPLEQVRPDVPGGVLAVLRKMVAKDPAKRFATPGDVATVIRPFCCPESRLPELLQKEESTPIRRTTRWHVRRDALVLLTAAVVALMIAAVFGLIYILRM